MKNIKTLAQDLKDGLSSFPSMVHYTDEQWRLLARIIWFDISEEIECEEYEEVGEAVTSINEYIGWTPELVNGMPELSDEELEETDEVLAKIVKKYFPNLEE